MLGKIIIVFCSILGAARGINIFFDGINFVFNGTAFDGKSLSKKEAGVQYFLWTPENPQNYQIISANNLTGLKESFFQTSRKTVFLIHGMGDQAEGTWVSKMCKELILHENLNCIGVDWHKASGNAPTYVIGVRNTFIIAEDVADFLKILKEKLGYLPCNVHIIGHSLGCHVAGFIGKRFHGLRRISALDCAHPIFSTLPSEFKIFYTDADYMDSIHTDVSLIGLGMAETVGHYAFYPNGGKQMPGCDPKVTSVLAENAFDAFGCNHQRAHKYFHESIASPGGFTSYPCNNYQNFTDGGCVPCPLHKCPTMGYHSEQFYKKTGKKQRFFLNTGADPFSNFMYKVILSINGEATSSDTMYISIYGDGGNVTDHMFKSGILDSKNTIVKLIDSGSMLEPLGQVEFLWKPTIVNFLKKRLGAGRIVVQRGEDGKTTSFCGNEMVLDGVTQHLSPCDLLTP